MIRKKEIEEENVILFYFHQIKTTIFFSFLKHIYIYNNNIYIYIHICLLF